MRPPPSSHSEFRPTVKRGPFDDPNAHLPEELPDEDLEYDDLVELYGYDEERGLSELVLEKGTKIIPLKDEYGAITWVDGTVTSTKKGSLDFQVIFPSSVIDSDTWTQTQSRNGGHMAISPGNAEKATGSIRDTLNARIHSMAPLTAWLTLAPTPTSWGLEGQDT